MVATVDAYLGLVNYQLKTVHDRSDHNTYGLSILRYSPLCSLDARSYSSSAALSFRTRRGFLQVYAGPFVQLEADADSTAPDMALPAVHICPSPLSFSFLPSAVYEILFDHLNGFIILFVVIRLLIWLIF